MSRKIAFNVVKTIAKMKSMTKIFLRNEDGFMMGFPTTFFSRSGPALSYVSSVQQVSITIAAGASTGTATISAVSSNAFLVFQGMNISHDAVYSEFAEITLTNSTTVTATRGAAVASFTTIIQCAVVDATSNLVDTVQFGTVSTTTTTGTATITSVDTTRSAVFYLGSRTTNSTGGIGYFPGIELTNATTVTVHTQSAPTNLVVGFVVVQFKAAAIRSVQKVAQVNGTASTATTTISSISTANAMLAYGYATFVTSAGASFCYQKIASATTVTTTKTSSSAGSNTAYCTVIEFVSGVLASAQRGSIAIGSGVSSATATISSVTTSLSLANYTGTAESSGTFGGFLNTITLTNATTVTAAHAITGAATVGYEVLQFN